VEIVVLDDDACTRLLQGWIADHPRVWAEDIGEE
jgi:creatinine deaminase